MVDLAARILKISKNENAYLLTEDRPPETYIDTGNLALNALISGDPFLGIPTNAIIQFAGKESTGKSFFSLEIVKQAQKIGYTVLYYDTEGAQRKSALLGRGIIPELFIQSHFNLIKPLQTDILNILKTVDAKKDKLLIVIDSIGMLNSSKQMNDAVTGNDKQDMTKQKELSGLFTTMTSDASLKNVPIIVINHVYDDTTSMYGATIVGGGKGSKLSSTGIFKVTKSQEKEASGRIVGAQITVTSEKNRLAREKTKVKVIIDYSRGLLRFSGLFDIALETNFIKEVKKGWYTYEGYEGPSLRKKDFNNEAIWKAIFDAGFYAKIKDLFAYRAATDGLAESEHVDLESFEGDVEPEEME